MTTRREFFGRAAKATAVGYLLVGTSAGSAVLLEGCGPITVTEVLNDIAAWEPLAEETFSSILTLLDGAASALQPLIVLIQAGFVQILSDVQSYLKITPPPSGALAIIQAILNDVATNFQQFLSSVNLSGNPIAGLIVNLAGIIVGAINGFISSLSSLTKVAMRAERKAPFVVAGQSIPVTPVLYTSKRQFKKTWNKAALAGGHPEIELKLTFWENF